MGPVTSLQRRLVERYRVEQFRLAWDVQERKAGLLGRRRESSSRAGEVMDVSITGAAVLAPTDPTIRRGSTVVIEVDGHRGAVRVRHVRPTEDPERSVYGIEFAEVEPELHDRFLRPIEEHRGKLPTREWMDDPPVR